MGEFYTGQARAGTRSAHILVVTRRPFAVAPIVAISMALLWSLGDLSAASSADEMFERVLARSNNVAQPPYRAYRRLEGGVSDSDKQGWLEAWTEHVPGRGLKYEVVREGGSAFVNKKLRNMLDSEQELITRGKRLHASFEAKNYMFADGGITDAGMRRILLTPAKKSDGILNGSVVLDASGLVTRIEGRLVKSPSFWLRDVDVVWKYASAGEHVVPVEMTSSGRVRMFGRSTFRMTYDYETIDGRPATSRLSATLRNER